MREGADSSGTLVVIALDAADYRLARRWDCGNVLLDNHGRIETFAYSKDEPITLEVWTSVATGVHPEEHGMSSTGEQQEWVSSLLRAAGTVAPYVLPKDLRVRLGTALRGDEDATGMTFGRTNVDHVFPEGGVYGWPGISSATHLSQTWHWLNLAQRGEITDVELWRRLYANAGKELGWAMGMARTDLPLIGVHMHILDAAGHAYANREDQLRDVYEHVDDMLGALRERVGTLVVLSDHGMQVSTIPEDDRPGDHSWRATFATTADGDRPESVFEVREWLEARIDTEREQSRTEAASLDTTREQLEDLGYL